MLHAGVAYIFDLWTAFVVSSKVKGPYWCLMSRSTASVIIRKYTIIDVNSPISLCHNLLHVTCILITFVAKLL